MLNAESKARSPVPHSAFRIQQFVFFCVLGVSAVSGGFFGYDEGDMYEPSFEVTQVGAVNVVMLRLPEMMDSHEFDRLNEEVLAAIAGAPQGRWVFDLANLNYMGSSSLGLMVNIRQRVKQVGGQLVLCSISAPLMKIFRTCCLERLFMIYRTRDEALQKLGK
jgi:stage II sporulation protein AA (anti-sigma F factor antagonist)